MARPKNLTPVYKLHKSTGLARCWVNGKWVSLGKYGSPDSRAEFARIVAELATSPSAPATAGPSAGLTVDEVLLAFWEHVERHYRDDAGNPTTEVNEIRRSLAPLRKLYGHTPAAAFGPRALASVRQEMITAGWCRTLVNRRTERVKRAFRWAVSQELVPASVDHALRTVRGLQKGRTEARESEPVKPVDPAHVASVLPHLNHHVRAMVELQRITGMRPGEVCGLTFAEVDRTGGTWVYRPTRHKTAHRGKERVVFLGPKARALLVAFVRGDHPPPDGFTHIDLNDPAQRNARLVAADAYQEAGRDRDAELLRDVARSVVWLDGCVIDPEVTVFSPARERVERYKRLRAARKSKVPPSQQNRAKADPQRSPSAEYHPHAYTSAIAKACRKAGITHWHPNQLRHTHATEVRKKYGVEGAQVALGHSHAAVTQVYAERDHTLAARIANEMG